MDALKICLVSFIFPVSAHLTRTSHQSLWFVLFTLNPFIIFLINTTLAKPPCSPQRPISVTKPANLRGASRDPPGLPASGRCDTSASNHDTYCCHHLRDKRYRLHKFWMLSVHATLIWIIRENLVSARVTSSGEMSLLYCGYILLASLVLNLRMHLKNVTRSLAGSNSIVVMPLTRAYAVDEDEELNTANSDQIMHAQHRRCDEICYLKLLLHPWAASKESHTSGTSTSSTRYDSAPVEMNPVIGDERRKPSDNIAYIKRMAQLMHNKSSIARALGQPSSSSYLALCNVVHLLILLHISYLNITFSCATMPSMTFGLSLLVPYECSTNLFDPDNNQARVSMFAGLYAAQLAFCQLAVIAVNSRSR